MGVEEEVEEVASDTAEEVASEVAEEVAEEVVSEEAGESDENATVVVVEDNTSGAETLNEGLDAAENVRTIAREEAYRAADQVRSELGAAMVDMVAAHEANMPHSSAVIVPPPSAEQDEDVPSEHWFFRNRRRA